MSGVRFALSMTKTYRIRVLKKEMRIIDKLGDTQQRTGKEQKEKQRDERINKKRSYKSLPFDVLRQLFIAIRYPY